MKSFFALIDKMDSAPAETRQVIERVIWESFGVERAVLALDMSNFSLVTRRDGILPYLGRIRRMQRVTEPIVVAAGGEVVKYYADNLIAVFPDGRAAVEAAVRMNRALAADGGADPIGVSVGIDYGLFLLVPGTDCYGDAVNRAHKLGEDLARGGEILITPEVAAQLGDPPPYRLEVQQLSVSGIEFDAHRVIFDPRG